MPHSPSKQGGSLWVHKCAALNVAGRDQLPEQWRPRIPCLPEVVHVKGRRPVCVCLDRPCQSLVVPGNGDGHWRS